jgi:hypothetical protein
LFFLVIKHLWRNEAAEFSLDQFGQLQRRRVLQPGPDYLRTDRQSVRREAGRNRGSATSRSRAAATTRKHWVCKKKPKKAASDDASC